MVIIDSSVWIGHLKSSNKNLVILLQEAQVLTHPMIVGELACGSMKSRDEFLSLLSWLPVCQTASHSEVLQFIDTHKLFGKGIGWVDVNLITSAVLSAAKIWTLDKNLHKSCHRLGISF